MGANKQENDQEGLEKMGFAEQISVYVIATLTQLPFHLMVALPWLVLAAGVAWVTRQQFSPGARYILVSGIAAIGMAPIYGAHLSMIPMYTLVVSGEIPIAKALVSLLLTWGAILAVGCLFRWSAKKNRKTSKS